MTSESLLQLAILASFWAGGVGLVILKAIAYAMSGSALVRSSMFESVGDVASTSVMWLTQKRVADTTDKQLYPVGKGRLTGLGVFFFSAFMCSGFTTVAIESLQEICSGPGEEGASADTNAVSDAVRRLLTEKPLVRWLVGGRSVDTLVQQYAAPNAASEDEDGSDHAVTVMLVVCVCVKVSLMILCSYVGRRATKGGAEMTQALAIDHRNDSITVALVLAVNAVVDRARQAGYDWQWLHFIDPVASLLLALWILHGWISSSLEQFHLLSDRLADNVDEGNLSALVDQTLKGSVLEFVQMHTHHVGEGLCVRVSVRVRDDQVKEVARLLEVLEKTLHDANDDVRDVQVQLFPEAGPVGAAGTTATLVRNVVALPTALWAINLDDSTGHRHRRTSYTHDCLLGCSSKQWEDFAAVEPMFASPWRHNRSSSSGVYHRDLQEIEELPDTEVDCDDSQELYGCSKSLQNKTVDPPHHRLRGSFPCSHQNCRRFRLLVSRVFSTATTMQETPQPTRLDAFVNQRMLL